MFDAISNLEKKKEARNLNFPKKKKIFIFFYFHFFIVIRKQKRSGPPGGSVLRPFFFPYIHGFLVVWTVGTIYRSRVCNPVHSVGPFFYYYYSFFSFFLSFRSLSTGVTQREGTTREIYNFFSHLHRHTIITAAVSSRVRLRYAD